MRQYIGPSIIPAFAISGLVHYSVNWLFPFTGLGYILSMPIGMLVATLLLTLIIAYALGFSNSSRKSIFICAAGLIFTWLVALNIHAQDGTSAPQQMLGAFANLSRIEKIERKNLYYHYGDSNPFFLREIALGKFSDDKPTEGLIVNISIGLADTVETYIERFGAKFRFPKADPLKFSLFDGETKIRLFFDSNEFLVPISDLPLEKENFQRTFKLQSGKYTLSIYSKSMELRPGDGFGLIMYTVARWLR